MNKFIKLALATCGIVFIAKAAELYGIIETIDLYDKDRTKFEELRRNVYDFKCNIDAAKKMLLKKK